MYEPLEKKWDDLLQDGFVTPPADFHARVMAQVVTQTEPAQPGRLRLAVQALALSAAAIAGLTQLAIFSFGVWSATAAH